MSHRIDPRHDVTPDIRMLMRRASFVYDVKEIKSHMLRADW